MAKRRTPKEREHAIFVRAADVQLRRLARSERIDDSRQADAYFRARLAHLPREEMHAMWLDGRFGLIASDLVALGCVEGALVEPRVLIQRALERNARHVILAHNHPSGDCTPSRADLGLTRQLIDTLRVIRVGVFDHLVIGAARSYSFNEAGRMPRD